MSIIYKLYPIRDNINQTPKQGLIPKVVSKGTISVGDLAKNIASATTFNKAEVIAIISTLSDMVEKGLKDGYNVNLGELGTFSISAESRIVQHKDEIRAGSIKVKRIVHKPSREMARHLKNATFERG